MNFRSFPVRFLELTLVFAILALLIPFSEVVYAQVTGKAELTKYLKENGLVEGEYNFNELYDPSVKEKVINLLSKASFEEGLSVESRTLALAELVRSDPVAGRDVTIRLIKMPNTEMQEKAAFIARVLPVLDVTFIMDKELINSLKGALSSHNNSLRRRAMSSLISFQSDEVVVIVENLLNDADEEIRNLAEIYLSSHKLTLESIDDLRSPNIETRRRGARFFISSRNVNAVPMLIKLLEDIDPTVRKYAALALGTTGLEQSIADLTIRFSKELEPEVREALIRGLLLANCTRQKKGVISVFIQALTDSDISVRKTAFYALGKQVPISMSFDPDGEEDSWRSQAKQMSQLWDTNMDKIDLRKCRFPGNEFLEVRGLQAELITQPGSDQAKPLKYFLKE